MEDTTPIEWFTRKELADYLGLSESTLASWATRGAYDLPYTKLGGVVRYKRSDVQAWIANRTTTQREREA